MTGFDQPLQTRVDAYLMRLRRSLGELPAEDVNDILREIRSHILERAEAAGDMTDETLMRILRELGQPEDIGPLYQADAMVARARSSFSPSLILRTTLRWGMRSVAGFVAFIAGIVGYSIAIGFFGCALLKPFLPDQIGLWMHPNGVSLGTISSQATAHDLLGWWIIPVGLVVGALLLVWTTHFLRWLLRYAVRRPIISAT
jgi:uncharacterized membrane protein